MKLISLHFWEINDGTLDVAECVCVRVCARLSAIYIYIYIYIYSSILKERDSVCECTRACVRLCCE